MLARFAALSLASITMLLAACSSDATTTTTPAQDSSPTAPEEDEGTAPVTGAFSEDEVQDLFNVKCVRCHARNNTLLDLSGSFAKSTIGVPAAGGRSKCADSEHRVRIVPGDREASLLWHKVSGTHDCGDAMPPSGKGARLTASELERLGLFIDGLPR